MEMNILWLYHDMKDVFGDAGNIQVLKKRCEARDIACHIKTCGLGETVDMCDYDLVYFGTNLHGKDTYVMQDLCNRKDNIMAAIENGTIFFLVCGGFQAFGNEYVYEDEIVAGLKILDFKSDYRNKANCIGNTYVECPWVKQTLIGFENHHYKVVGVQKPLGKVIMGKGNDASSTNEGYFDGQILGTNLHGPLLPKNPELADNIILAALSKRNPDIVITTLSDTYEEKARMAIQKRFKADV